MSTPTQPQPSASRRCIVANNIIHNALRTVNGTSGRRIAMAFYFLQRYGYLERRIENQAQGTILRILGEPTQQLDRIISNTIKPKQHEHDRSNRNNSTRPRFARRGEV